MWKWILLAFALSFAFFAIQSADVLMYLALARDYLFKGEWREVDLYTYAQTDGVLVWWHEYLSYVIFYGAWAALGPPGLVLLKAALLAIMFWLVLRAGNERQNSNPLWIAIWVLAVLAGSFRFVERSSLFSDLFTVLIVTWLLKESRITRALIARLSVLFFIWIQLHPGFVTGLIFLAAWTLTRTASPSQKLKVLLWPIAALCLNPKFLDGVLYPFRFSLNEAVTLRRFNFEWFPAFHPAFRFAPEVLAFWLLATLSAVFLIRARAWRSREALFGTVAFLLTISAVRFMPWAAMVLAVVAKPHAHFRRVNLERPALRLAVAALLMLIAAKNLTWGYNSSSGERHPRLDFDPAFFPVKTIEVYAANRIPGRLYNSHDFGSQLIWQKATPVFHHGFVTDMKFYRDEVIGAMTTTKRFQELAAKYDWTMLLVDKHGGYREFHRILSPLSEWKIVGEDDAAYLIFKMPGD